MGSLFEGAAKGVNAYTVRQAEQGDLIEREDLQRQHDIRLENMRNKHAMDTATQQNDWRVEAATTADERAVSAATAADERAVTAATQLDTRAQANREDTQMHEYGVSMNENRLEVWKTNAEINAKNLQAGLARLSGKAGSNQKAGPWSVEFQPAGMDENGVPITKLYATNSNYPGALEDHGMRMIPANLSPEDQLIATGIPDEKDGKSGEQQLHDAEMILLGELAKGNDSSMWFLKTFKHLPKSYYIANFEMSKSKLNQDFFQKQREQSGGPSFLGPNETPLSPLQQGASASAGAGPVETQTVQKAANTTQALSGAANALEPPTGPTPPSRGDLAGLAAPTPAAAAPAGQPPVATAQAPDDRWQAPSIEELEQRIKQLEDAGIDNFELMKLKGKLKDMKKREGAEPAPGIQHMIGNTQKAQEWRAANRARYGVSKGKLTDAANQQ